MFNCSKHCTNVLIVSLVYNHDSPCCTTHSIVHPQFHASQKSQVTKCVSPVAVASSHAAADAQEREPLKNPLTWDCCSSFFHVPIERIRITELQKSASSKETALNPGPTMALSRAWFSTHHVKLKKHKRDRSDDSADHLSHREATNVFY